MHFDPEKLVLGLSFRMHREHRFDFTPSQAKIRNTVGLEYHFGEGLRL